MSNQGGITFKGTHSTEPPALNMPPYKICNDTDDISKPSHGPLMGASCQGLHVHAGTGFLNPLSDSMSEMEDSLVPKELMRDNSHMNNGETWANSVHQSEGSTCTHGCMRPRKRSAPTPSSPPSARRQATQTVTFPNSAFVPGQQSMLTLANAVDQAAILAANFNLYKQLEYAVSNKMAQMENQMAKRNDCQHLAALLAEEAAEERDNRVAVLEQRLAELVEVNEKYRERLEAENTKVQTLECTVNLLTSVVASLAGRVEKNDQLVQQNDQRARQAYNGLLSHVSNQYKILEERVDDIKAEQECIAAELNGVPSQRASSEGSHIDKGDGVWP